MSIIPKNSQGQIDFHRILLEEQRKREDNNYKFLFTLIGGTLSPVLSIIISDKNLTASNENILTIVSLGTSVFIFWWAAKHILAQSYQYRKLQEGLSIIQNHLQIPIPSGWDTRASDKYRNVLTEFYKPHYCAFIVAYGISSFILLVVFLKSFFNQNCGCVCNYYLNTLTITCFTIMILGGCNINNQKNKLNNKLNSVTK